MTGIVTADREAILEVPVLDVSGQERKYPSVVDTGYTGWLTLPPDVIAALGLTWRERGGAMLADGSYASFDVYNATVIWDGQPIAIPVDEVDSDPLVGMSLMYGYELVLPVLDGATFMLRRIVNP